MVPCDIVRISSCCRRIYVRNKNLLLWFHFWSCVLLYLMWSKVQHDLANCHTSQMLNYALHVLVFCSKVVNIYKKHAKFPNTKLNTWTYSVSKNKRIVNKILDFAWRFPPAEVALINPSPLLKPLFTIVIEKLPNSSDEKLAMILH